MKKGGKSIYTFFLLSCIAAIINMEWLNNMQLIAILSLLEGYIAAFIVYYFIIPTWSYAARYFSKSHRYNKSLNKFVFPQVQIFPNISHLISMYKAGKEANSIVQAHKDGNDLSGFEDSPYSMLVIDNKDRCIAANAAACRQYGYSKLEMHMLPVQHLYSFETLEKMNSDSYVHHKNKNGDILQVTMHYRSIVYNGQTARLAIFIDASEKLHIENKHAGTELAY